MRCRESLAGRSVERQRISTWFSTEPPNFVIPKPTAAEESLSTGPPARYPSDWRTLAPGWLKWHGRFFPLVRGKSHVPNACRAQMRGAPPLVENPYPRATEPRNPTLRKLRNVVHPAVALGSAGVSPAFERAFDRGFRARTRCRQDAGATVGPRLASAERVQTWGTV